MLTNEDISKYLKMGFIEDLKYGDIHQPINISFKEAKIQFKSILEKNISKFNDNECAFVSSGGINSASILSFKNGPSVNTFGFTGNWSTELSNHFNTTHHLSDFSTIKEDLIEINKLWKNTPRLGTIGDVFIYNRLKKIRELGFKIDVCEGGTDWLLLSYIFMYSDLIGLTIKRSEYNVNYAKSIIKKSKYQKSINLNLDKALLVNNKQSYINTFIKNYGVFSDDEIKSFGYIPPKYELKEDNLLHLIQAINDWVSPNKLTSKTFAENFGIKLESPYFMSKEMINFCLNLPVEFRFCHGSKKHIMRESLGSSLPIFILYRNHYNPDENNFINVIDQISQLDKLYLKNPNLKLYNYLDYNTVNNIKSFRKHWHLLNFSVWLEVNQ